MSVLFSTFARSGERATIQRRQSMRVTLNKNGSFNVFGVSPTKMRELRMLLRSVLKHHDEIAVSGDSATSFTMGYVLTAREAADLRHMQEVFNLIDEL